MDRLVEARRSRCWRRTANSLLQVCVGSTVVELDGPDAAKEVVVASILRITRRSRESGLQDKLVGLVVEVVVEIVAEKTVDEGCLSLVIVTKRSSPLSSQEQPNVLVRMIALTGLYVALTDVRLQARPRVHTFSRRRTTPSQQ